MYIPDEGIDYTQEYDELAYPRNSYDECVEYITDELRKLQVFYLFSEEFKRLLVQLVELH